jgi:hypothetical protein
MQKGARAPHGFKMTRYSLIANTRIRNAHTRAQPAGEIARCMCSDNRRTQAPGRAAAAPPPARKPRRRFVYAAFSCFCFARARACTWILESGDAEITGVAPAPNCPCSFFLRGPESRSRR